MKNDAISQVQKKKKKKIALGLLPLATIFEPLVRGSLQLRSNSSRKRKENRENSGGMDGEHPRGRGW